MRYYSTNKQSPLATLEEAVIKGLACDKGLFMPEMIPVIDKKVIAGMKNNSFQENAHIEALAFFGEDMDSQALTDIVYDTLSYETPVVHVHDNLFSFVLYPKGQVSQIQECQFTTLGQNITALEINGTFDDCQALVKAAFVDDELNRRMLLTSANSINVARFLPQAFYYFDAYAQLDRIGKADELVVCVPSGNLGNLTAGLFAYKMGLPVKHFIAANNRNDILCEYLNTGAYNPRPSVETYANAMDVGNPSNFARIRDLFDNSHELISRLISGYRYTNEQIVETIREVYRKYDYLLDPHGACGYQALVDIGLHPDETGLFLETAHPAKFKETVDMILNADIAIPSKLQAFMKGEKKNVPLSKDFKDFKNFLLF